MKSFLFPYDSLFHLDPDDTPSDSLIAGTGPTRRAIAR